MNQGWRVKVMEYIHAYSFSHDVVRNSYGFQYCYLLVPEICVEALFKLSADDSRLAKLRASLGEECATRILLRSVRVLYSRSLSDDALYAHIFVLVCYGILCKLSRNRRL